MPNEPDGYANLARELMRPDPIKQTIYQVTVIVEKINVTEHGYRRVAEVPYAEIVSSGADLVAAEDLADKLAAYARSPR